VQDGGKSRQIGEVQVTCTVRGRQEVWQGFSQDAVGGTRIFTLLGGKRRINCSNMGELIKTRKRKLAGRWKHDARLGRVVQVKKRGRGNPLI